MINIYVKLFNIVLNTAIIPESWTMGIINPIYKNKGAESDANNYRPITLLSCLGKFFTAIINSRLQKYTESHNIINDYQTGFRSGFSTVDNMFILHSLIQILQKKKKKLFCAFIDLKQAFDTIWRSGLWSKLINNNINGKCLNLIKSMYANIKSCVAVNGHKSNYFPSNIGVRQGENLSPILFSLYLNDLHSFILNSGNVNGIKLEEEEFDNNLINYLKLFILLYADDTVIVSESAEDLQNALNTYSVYCNSWKLKLNTSKTKVLIFSKGRQRLYNFKFENENIETVSEYKYLGIFFNRSGSFLIQKNI